MSPPAGMQTTARAFFEISLDGTTGIGMAARKTEIIGTYLGPAQRWGDTVLGRIDYEDPSGQPARLTIKGRDANNNLKLHQRYRFYGRWTSYKHKPPKNFTERQFAFDTYILSTPASRQGVIAYLKELPGIALGLATKLWDAYGPEAVEMLRTQPERVAREIAGMSAAKASEAAAALGETSKAERANIDILGMLAGRGFPRTIAPRLLQKFGNRAAELIQRNPYLLMQFPGCGFKRADKMYLDLGHPPGRLKRQALCLAKAAGDDGDGHTWLPAGRICASLDGNIGGAEPQHARALYLAKRARKVDTLRDRDDRLWVADYTRAQQEQYIAQRVAEMLSEGPPDKWPEPDELKGVSDHQRDKTAQALRGRLAILTGGPGTGKTHTLASIISAIEDFEYPTSFPGRRRPKIEICAPTGKAAVRMTSALAQAGHIFDGMTIHCLLNVKAVDGGGWSFHYNARNPLKCDILIVDECFAPSTLVDTPTGAKPIETIVPGSVICNAVGLDQVIATKRTEVTRVVHVTYRGETVCCSENHPWLTTRGWVVAGELRPGDSLVQSTTAMRLLREGDYSKKEWRQCSTSAILYSILRGEMVAELSVLQGTGIYARASHKGGGGSQEVSTIWQPRSLTTDCQDYSSQSNVLPRRLQEDFSEIESDGTQAAAARGQWSRTHQAAAIVIEHARQRLDCGAHCLHSFAGYGLSETLQNRSCKCRQENCNRNRRLQSFDVQNQTGRSEENSFLEIVRVDGVEILERGDPRLDRLRDADGRLYFYDLQAARHPSFSVSGVLVHNCSMLGVPLAASLFAAIPPECHVLLVGDIGQLPPVEHGAVLRDLIAAGVPCGELTEPRRNSGAIVDCCTAIRRGTAPIVAPGIDLKAANPQNLVLGHATTPDEQKDRLLAAIDVARQLDMDPIWDFQVLVPLNDKSDVSRKRLNAMLQNLLNPQGLSVAGNPFRVGDKVINLKNGMYDAFRDKPADGAEHGDEPSDAKHFVANGDMGKVAAVGAKWTRVQLQTPDRDIIVPHGEIKEESEGDGEGGSEEATKARWDLAYAVTVHKSQGSQWPVVAVMLDEHASAMRLTSREWIFTAISRAQKLCLLIGRKQKLEAMCRRQVLGTRKTFLAELLPEKITLQALAKM